MCFDTERPEWQAMWNPVQNLVYNADGRSVHTVVVAGRVVVDGYRPDLRGRAEAVRAECRRSASGCQARTGITFPTSRWPIV